ncbi:MAG: ATP-binding protein [Oscillospiraceae bacterium]|nr:ATP-binding protein [Oscillospiraceae bacterium]
MAETLQTKAQAFVDAVISNIERTRAKDEQDYIDGEGLLVCRQCGTPKQARLELPNIGERVVPIGCECAMEKYAAIKEAERRAECERYRQRYIDLEKCRKYRFAQDDGRNAGITAVMQKYANNFGAALAQNIGLLLYGGVGTGKTYYAGCIANQLIDDGYSVVMTSISQIVEYTGEFAKSRAKKDDYEEHLDKSDLLILDDLGVERNTEYMEERIYTVINKRYGSGKPLIVTTNLSKNQIQTPQSMERQRTYDRIVEICKAVEVPGSSRRVENSNKLQKTFAEIFGA